MADPARKLFAVQFHPEVAHTPQGKTVLKNFLARAEAGDALSARSRSAMRSR
jgi:GMP synthase-like glutamine amidotransferase